jgi:hypothetical protein
MKVNIRGGANRCPGEIRHLPLDRHCNSGLKQPVSKGVILPWPEERGAERRNVCTS